MQLALNAFDVAEFVVCFYHVLLHGGATLGVVALGRKRLVRWEAACYSFSLSYYVKQ